MINHPFKSMTAFRSTYISVLPAYFAQRRSPLGQFGGWTTVAICAVTLVWQVQDTGFLHGTFWVMIWLGAGCIYCSRVSRHRLILSPEEAAASPRLLA